MAEASPWLGIDTASAWASVALVGPGSVLGERSWHGRRRHTRELAPVVATMLGEVALEPKALGGVAVAIGPGSYTGLRIGLSFAKGLALPAKLPLVGLPTLHATAAPLLPPHGEAEHTLWAVLGAGRGRVVAARYAAGGDPADWPDPADLPVLRPEALAERVEPGDRVAGELDDLLRARLAGAGATIVAAPAALRRASWLAWLGARRAGSDTSGDLETLEPVYPGGAP